MKEIFNISIYDFTIVLILDLNRFKNKIIMFYLLDVVYVRYVLKKKNFLRYIML